jgi:hypothetical protein
MALPATGAKARAVGLKDGGSARVGGSQDAFPVLVDFLFKWKISRVGVLYLAKFHCRSLWVLQRPVESATQSGRHGAHEEL